MNAFFTVGTNVAVMMFYLLCGLLLTLFKKSVASHAKTLSAILVYVCSPALIISSFQSINFSWETAKQIGIFFAFSLVIQILFFVVLYAILHKKMKDAKYRILTVGATLGNVGFFGLPLVTSLFPEAPLVACYSSVYVMSMNLLVFTLGTFMITADKKFISVKAALLNPTVLAIAFALPFFFFDIHFPQPITQTLDLLGKMSTPVCMFVLGMRLATVKFKDLFTRPFAYVTCALKLIVFPLFAYLCVYFLPFVDATFKTCMLVLSAAPSAAVILSLAELHECEQELSANVLLLATILSVATLPLIVLIV